MKTNHTPGPWRAKENGIIDTESPFHGHIIATVNLDSGARNKMCKANIKLIGASPLLLNSALLDNCFPMITEKDKEKTFELAKSFGWEMDEPVEIFAMKLRSIAIKKATE